MDIANGFPINPEHGADFRLRRCALHASNFHDLSNSQLGESMTLAVCLGSMFPTVSSIFDGRCPI
jgi:hypothetical protein